MPKQKIQAQLIIHDHGKMSDKQFKLFKRWIKSVASEMQKHKRGELSKIFRATLFKV
jgi:hypothetical protein